jgi:hypothetical protein
MADIETFPAFRDFLLATQEYAKQSGFRFRLGSPEFSDDEKASIALHSEKVKARDASILQDLARAYKISEQEGIRNVMVATCKELHLWPPASTDHLESMAYTDVSEPLETIAWALYNYDRSIDESQSDREHHDLKCRTASYLVDFAQAVGENVEMSKAGSELLLGFLRRAKEWTDAHKIKRTTLKDLVLKKLAEFADERFIGEVESWLDKHWEAVAVGSIALVAGFALAALAFRSSRHHN